MPWCSQVSNVDFLLKWPLTTNVVHTIWEYAHLWNKERILFLWFSHLLGRTSSWKYVSHINYRNSVIDMFCSLFTLLIQLFYHNYTSNSAGPFMHVLCTAAGLHKITFVHNCCIPQPKSITFLYPKTIADHIGNTDSTFLRTESIGEAWLSEVNYETDSNISTSSFNASGLLCIQYETIHCQTIQRYKISSHTHSIGEYFVTFWCWCQNRKLNFLLKLFPYYQKWEYFCI